MLGLFKKFGAKLTVTVLFLLILVVPTSIAQPLQIADFYVEPNTPPPSDASPVAPSFEGKVVVRDGTGEYRLLPRPRVPSPLEEKPLPDFPPAPGGDLYLQDGSETSIAVNASNGNNLIATYNEGWNFNPDIPHSNSTDGNVSWTSRSFPDGSGTFTGAPFDPWANAGNTGGEFFSTQIRRDTTASGNSHVVISRSADTGASFSLFFERVKAVFQDREMVDVDRTAARGGGTGTTHDGKVYMCYDDFGSGGAGYAGSYFQVVSSAGSGLLEIQVSGTGTPPFRGSQFQPVAGIVDGTIYFLSVAISGGGATRVADFHEITGGGSGTITYIKSTLTWAAVGQQLGATSRYGLNGHRIDSHGYLDIDRSGGARHGYLFFISNRNPNPGDSTQDQGDIHFSISSNGATTWSTAVVPTAANKTQYFPMLDVDEQGWLHAAYYQNETGGTNNGVLNAGTANLYYTLSTDGGSTWSSPIQVNAVVNALDYEDPPPDRSGVNYYLVGDYAQIRATGSGISTKVYILWSGYDEDRNDGFVGDLKERVFCTTVTGLLPDTPTPTATSTDTPVPPTDTPAPPTNTFTPTDTPAPPTDTFTPTATDTPNPNTTPTPAPPPVDTPTPTERPALIENWKLYE